MKNNITALGLAIGIILHLLLLFALPARTTRAVIPSPPVTLAFTQVSRSHCDGAVSEPAEPRLQEKKADQSTVRNDIHRKKAAPVKKRIPATPQQSTADKKNDSAPDSAPAMQKARSSAPTPDLFLSKIRSLIERKKYYPRLARRLSHEGTAVLRLVIAANGSIDELHLLQSSGYSLLDKAALDAVKKAGPFPSPRDSERGSISLTIPLHYCLD